MSALDHPPSTGSDAAVVAVADRWSLRTSPLQQRRRQTPQHAPCGLEAGAAHIRRNAADVHSGSLQQVDIDGISWIIELLSLAAEEQMMEGLIEFYYRWAGLSCLIGFLLLAHAHDRKTYIRRVLRYGRKAEGRVLELRQATVSMFGADQRDGYAPVVEYKDYYGNMRKHYSTTYQADCKYQVGDVVTVWYQKHPSVVDSALADDQPGETPRILFMVGISFLAIGLPVVMPRVLALLGVGA